MVKDLLDGNSEISESDAIREKVVVELRKGDFGSLYFINIIPIFRWLFFSCFFLTGKMRISRYGK